MKKQITRSLCCLLAVLLCLGSALYVPAAQDDRAQVSFTVTLHCLQNAKESEVTVPVPMHTYSRQA